MNGKIKVMLTTEGTYPFHQGGVSTWCDNLIHRLDDIDFVLYSIIMNPFVTQKFTLPPGTELIKVPLWGTEEPSEHLPIPFSQVYMAKKRTSEKVVRDRFIPLFNDLIKEILSLKKDPKKFGNILFGMHEYLQEFEYKNSFKSESTWTAFKDYVLSYVRDGKNMVAEPDIYSLIQALGWVYRFLNILNTPIPKVHVVHSAAAAFCGIPAVLSKLKHKSAFLLTEHGVYLREQYLSLSRRAYPSFLSSFLMRMIHSITSLNYEFADQVSPVCQYNTRWEKLFGVKPEKIKVIYNGVDKKAYVSQAVGHKNKHPVVVSLSRIDPMKDILTLIRAAAVVKKRLPQVKFIVYGSVSVPKYFDECIELRAALDLADNFIFAGHTDDVLSAYRSGDIVVLSSISEAFPYSIIEAMMIGKPIIATDVGGIKEALGETGIVVRPRQPEELAKSIMNLIDNPELMATLAEEARQRALNLFTIERFASLYLKSYINLIAGQKESAVVYAVRKKQLPYVQKGFGQMLKGRHKEAIASFRMAIREAADAPCVPAILTSIADAYNCLGMYDHAFNELDKALALAKIIELKTTA